MVRATGSNKHSDRSSSAPTDAQDFADEVGEEVRNHDEQRLPAAPTDTQGLADEAGEEALIDNSVSDVKEQARPCVQRQSTLAAFDWDRSSAAPTHTQDIADEVGVEAVNNALELGKPLPDKAEMAESREVVLEAGTLVMPRTLLAGAIGLHRIPRRPPEILHRCLTMSALAPRRTLRRASHPTQVDEVTDELLRAELAEAKEVPGMKAESDSEMGETSSRSELGKAAETATEVEVGTEKLSKLVEEPEYRRYRPFTPYRHAPTAEDLLHRAIRGRALALPGAISQASHPTQVDEVTDELSGADKLAEAREGAEPGGASRFKEAERAIIPKVDETSGEVSGADDSRLVAQEAREGTESEEAPHHMEAEKGIDDVLDSDGGVTMPSLYRESVAGYGGLRNALVEKDVQPLDYIKIDEFVVFYEDSNQWIHQEDWNEWISPFCFFSTPPPPVVLYIIRPENQPCCSEMTENASGSAW
ncbi:hypothetical protein B0H13DRAFT_2554550 [Mycena leptocephala]|nr:hypothetical protein B0H13DRAFT_2554550 [Mycena leptocephala]